MREDMASVIVTGPCVVFDASEVIATLVKASP